MLTDYLEAAMRRGEYEQMPDGSWWGSIPGFKGLWADAPTQEACRAELRSALEDWVLFTLNRQLAMPVLDGIDLTVTDVA
jgi:predicted RNase H-like HicB family nuclease